jgi:hypothetical protein
MPGDGRGAAKDGEKKMEAKFDPSGKLLKKQTADEDEDEDEKKPGK